jgi:hypothetical protein
VHIWAGIWRKGRTEICIFEGIMDRFLFTEILDRTLVPFVEKEFPNSSIYAGRIMIQNIRLSTQEILSSTTGTIGGRLQQNPLISAP